MSKPSVIFLIIITSFVSSKSVMILNESSQTKQTIPKIMQGIPKFTYSIADLFCNKIILFNAVDGNNGHMLEEFIINALIGIHHKYCIGWVIEAQICKNSQTNCCHGNFVNKPTDFGFKDGSCADFEFELSKDEMTIKLVPWKELEVQKTKLN